MKYRRLLLGGFLAMGLAVTTASGALAEQIVAVNSPVESVGGQATKVTDAGQNAADTSQATVNSSVNTDTTQSAAGNTQTDTAQNTEASAAKPDPASITPTATGISIYISKRQSKLTLMQNKQAIGVWDAKLGRQSATDDKVQEGMRSPLPAVSMYVPEMTRASIIWHLDCPIQILRMQKEVCPPVLLPRNSTRRL